MSQPREHYRECNESTSITADKVVGSRVKIEAITMETPPIKQPQGVQVQSEGEDELWPLSGKPLFDIVIRKSNISGMYQMLMPSRMQKELSCATVPVVVTYRGNKWEMVYTSYQGSRRLQRAGWKQFAVDNHLKIRDACVFELVECSSDRIEFKVQILRGDFPAELLEQIEGSTRENPLVVP